MSVLELLRSKNLVEYIQGVYGDDMEHYNDGTYRTTCKFHDNADNPSSFAVFPDSTCHCFSCGFHTDIIGYVMERESVLFDQAVRILCENYSIDLNTDETYKRQMSLADRNEQWCKTYERSRDKCVDYLTEKRGLTLETIEKYRIGYSEKSSAITIPMLDQYGRIVSFGYRFFSGKVKYKNGNNNELFTKGEYLFNIDKAMRRLKKQKSLYVAEGFFDSIAADQMGEACVSYCGITFSKAHVLLIRELTQRINGVKIILAPDNDNKADKFIARGRELFQKYYPEASVKVVLID